MRPHEHGQTPGVVERCVAAIEVVVFNCIWGPSVTEENAPERRLKLANTKGFA